MLKAHGIDQAYVRDGPPLVQCSNGMDVLLNGFSCQSMSGEVSAIADIIECIGVCAPDCTEACQHDEKCKCKEEGKEEECLHQHACVNGLAVITLPFL